MNLTLDLSDVSWRVLLTGNISKLKCRVGIFSSKYPKLHIKKQRGPLKVICRESDDPLPDKWGQFGSKTLGEIKAPLTVSPAWLWL